MARPVLYLNVRSAMPRMKLRHSCGKEGNTMTLISEVLINGSLYLGSLGVLALAWARLQSEKRLMNGIR